MSFRPLTARALKRMIKLRDSFPWRVAEGSALVAGSKLCRDLAARAPPRALVLSDDLVSHIIRRSVEAGSLASEGSALVCASEVVAAAERCGAVLWSASPVQLRRLTGQPSPDGVVLEVPLPGGYGREEDGPALEAALRPGHAVILDGVGDPGNVGALLRSAAAFGWSAAIAMPDCADPWAAKALRAAQGATPLLRTLRASHVALEGAIEGITAAPGNERLALCVADTQGEPVERAAALLAHARRTPLLAMGSEGRGPSNALERVLASLPCAADPASAEAPVAALRVTVPMVPGGVESLNVAVSAGILAHAFRPPLPLLHGCS